MSSITGFKVSFVGLLVGEETNEYSKFLTNKAFKDLLEKGGAHLSKEVTCNTTHFVIGKNETAFKNSKSDVAIREQNEKRKQKMAAKEQQATGAGEEDGTPAKKKAKTSESKKPLEPIVVAEFGSFLDEHGLRNEWVAEMETADFTKEKVPIKKRIPDVIRKHTNRKKKVAKEEEEQAKNETKDEDEEQAKDDDEEEQAKDDDEEEQAKDDDEEGQAQNEDEEGQAQDEE